MDLIGHAVYNTEWGINGCMEQLIECYLPPNLKLYILTNHCSHKALQFTYASTPALGTSKCNQLHDICERINWELNQVFGIFTDGKNGGQMHVQCEYSSDWSSLFWAIA